MWTIATECCDEDDIREHTSTDVIAGKCTFGSFLWSYNHSLQLEFNHINHMFLQLLQKVQFLIIMLQGYWHRQCLEKLCVIFSLIKSIFIWNRLNEDKCWPKS